MIFQLLLSLLFSYLGLNLVFVMLRNRKAHKFLEERAPDVPTLPNPNIFSGHMYKLFYAPKNIKWIREMHEKYGDTFGFYVAQYPVMMTKNLKLIKHINLEKGSLHIDKHSFHFPMKEYHNSLFGLNGEDWRRCRKALAPVYTNSKVKSPEITGNIKERVKYFEEILQAMLNDSVAKTGKREFIFTASDMMHRFAMSIFLSIGFKKDDAVDFYSKHDPLIRDFQKGISDGSNMVLGFPVIYPPLRPVMKLLSGFSQFGKLRDRIISMMGNIIDDYKKYREQYRKEVSKTGSTNQKDFSEVSKFGNFQRRLIDQIVDAYLNKQITYDQLIGNMWSSFIAGYATTADSMSSLAWLLAQHPEVQEKLRKVLRDDGIESEYVHWCILEGLRLFPSVPFGAGRMLAEDVVIDGVLYPKGVFVFLSVTEVQTDPRYWEDPLVFNPDRWSKRELMDQASFITFGLGPRDCPGRHLAIQESKLIFEMILNNYRIEKCDETPDSYDISSSIMILTVPDKPIKLRFVPINSE